MATSGERNTKMREGGIFNHTLAVGAVINKGAIVVLDAGLAKAGFADANVVTVGMAMHSAAQAEGELSVDVRKGTFHYRNSAAADEITAADIGSDCYLVDDDTVAKTNGGGARSVAGKIEAIDGAHVWITI